VKPALLPWVFPLAILLAVAVASVGSPLLDIIVYLIVLFGVVPLGFAWLRRRELLPAWLARLVIERDENGRPRFPGF
jgi:hypothetical protein